MCTFFLTSEIYEASRWHADSIYNAPMVSTRHGHIYTGDIVKCRGINGYSVIYAKVLRFIKIVSYSNYAGYSNT